MNVLDLVFDEVNRDLDRIRKRVDGLTTRTERAETAGGVEAKVLADAPLLVDGSTGGDLLFITDARKVGEGAGAGTGTLCYYNPPTNSWYRVGDDTAAAI